MIEMKDIKIGDTVLFFNEINYGERNLNKYKVKRISQTAKGIVYEGYCDGIRYRDTPRENLFHTVDEFVMVKSMELSTYLKRNKTMDSKAIMDLFGIPTKDNQYENKKRYLNI